MTPIDPDLHAILACPACRGEVRLVEADRTLFCDRCRRPYLINDRGVPIMTVEDE